MEGRKVKFAVLGYGHIGKRHAEMIKKNSEAELVAVIDVLDRQTIGLTDEDIPYFNSLEGFLSSKKEVDVINIATPNGYHAKHATMVLQSDIHVVIEKPIALKSTEVLDLISLANKKGKHIFPVMQNRYSPPSVWIKDVIENNVLGKIFVVQLSCYWNRDERYYTKNSWHGDKLLDGGTLYTQFSHFIDMMYWLFGDIDNVQSKIFNFNHQDLTQFEDSGVITFDFVSGGTGVFNYSTAVYDENFESSLTIIAENGTVKIGGQYMNEVVYCNVRDYKMPALQSTDGANDYGNYKGSAANHHYIIQNVIDTLKGKDVGHISVEDACRVIGIIEKIYKTDYYLN